MPLFIYIYLYLFISIYIYLYLFISIYIYFKVYQACLFLGSYSSVIIFRPELLDAGFDNGHVLENCECLATPVPFFNNLHHPSVDSSTTIFCTTA